MMQPAKAAHGAFFSLAGSSLPPGLRARRALFPTCGNVVHFLFKFKKANFSAAVLIPCSHSKALKSALPQRRFFSREAAFSHIPVGKSAQKC